MRYRRIPESVAPGDHVEDQVKQQRVSFKLVSLLGAIVLLMLLWFSEWTDKSTGIDDITNGSREVHTFPITLTAAPFAHQTNRRTNKPTIFEKVTVQNEGGKVPRNDEVASSEGDTEVNNGNDDGDDIDNSAVDDDDEEEAPSIVTRRRPVCPRHLSDVILLFPHVNKAGGRTVEGTFDTPSNPRPQFLPLARGRRSRRMSFTLIDGHRDYDEIRTQVETMETRGICVRWIFMLRDPIARTLSAFNTMVGRSEPVYSKLSHHFYCDSPMITNLMRNESFTIEDFANLPAEERKTCQKSYHVRYLSGKGMNLEKAKKRLMRMSFVGLAEEFSLAMQLLNWELDLDLELFTPVFNKNPYSKEEPLSDKARQALEELNTLDIELYNFAKTNFYLPRLEAMRRFYGGSLPWKDTPAVCDSKVICWDKKFRFTNRTWGYNEEPPAVARLNDPGVRKQNMLCAPEKGCTLTQPGLREIPKANLNNTPPALAHPSQSLCMASLFIVGTRKGGTTSLYQYFVEHPNFRGILLNRGAQSGETFFFETRSFPVGDPHQLPPARLREMYDLIYAHEFQRVGLMDGLDPTYYMTGESSVGMGASCYAARLLKETCGPKIKVIYLLRDPLDRMISQYQMRVRLKMVEVEDDFTTYARNELRAIKTHPLYKELQDWVRLKDILSAPPPCLFTKDWTNGLWTGLYLVHLARWYRQLDPSNILVVQSEEFFRNPKSVYVQSLEFAQLDVNLVDAAAVTKQVFNAALRNEDDEDEERKKVIQELKGFFRPWNEALFKWLKSRNVEINTTLWNND